MKLAVISVIVFIATLVAPEQAQRTGLIRVFAVTHNTAVDGRQHLVVKRVRDRKTRPIGHIGQVCTRLPASGRESCVGTLEMPLGRIMYQGTRSSAGYYVFAVVGGTGAYTGARGSMVARTVSTGPRVEWLLVSLV